MVKHLQLKKERAMMLLAADYVLINTWKGSWHPIDAAEGEVALKEMEDEFKERYGSNARYLILKLKAMRG